MQSLSSEEESKSETSLAQHDDIDTELQNISQLSVIKRLKHLHISTPHHFQFSK